MIEITKDEASSMYSLLLMEIEQCRRLLAQGHDEGEPLEPGDFMALEEREKVAVALYDKIYAAFHQN